MPKNQRFYAFLNQMSGKRFWLIFLCFIRENKSFSTNDEGFCVISVEYNTYNNISVEKWYFNHLKLHKIQKHYYP